MRLPARKWSLFLGAAVAAVSGFFAEPQADPGRGAWLFSMILILRGQYRDHLSLTTVAFGWVLVVVCVLMNHLPFAERSLYLMTLVIGIEALVRFLFYDFLLRHLSTK
jgi:hypothetical protein